MMIDARFSESASRGGKQEAGWNLYLAVFVSLNQPSRVDLFDVEVNTIGVVYDIGKDLTF